MRRIWAKKNEQEYDKDNMYVTTYANTTCTHLQT